MTKYYVYQDGTYAGGFCDYVENGVVYPTNAIPFGAIEVPTSPEHAKQKWDFKTNSYLPLEG